MTYARRTRAIEILRGLGALAVFAILLVGVPTGLYIVAGSPIPGHVPTWEQITAILLRPDTDNRLFLAAVRLLGWTAWTLFAAATCTETICYLAGRTTPSLPRPVRPLQLLARDLVATTTLLFGAAAALSAPASATAHAGTDAPSAHEPSASPTQGTEWEPLLSDATPQTPEPDQPAWRTRIIHRGDTLWDLARRAYGSGDHYLKIFKASRAVDQPDGIPALTDPDDIHPGQHVRIPQARKKTASPPPTRKPGSANTGTSSKSKQSKEGSHTPRAPRVGSGATADKPSQVPSPVVAPPAESSPAIPPQPTLRSAGKDRTSSAITLSSGSYIGLGLAAALSLAIAATRLHRRRRRPLADTADVPATPSAPPEPVAKARKAHLDRAYVDHDDPIPSDADLVIQDRTAPPADHITLGTRDRTTVTLPLPGLNLGLTGSGARSAARAATTELLAKAHRDRAEVLIPRPDAQILYPDTPLTGIPGLTITPTPEAAITQLEAEVLRRARLLEAANETDLAAVRATDPAEPLPNLLLVATIPETTAATVHAITQLGRRYGIGALILGPCPAGTTVHLSDDVTVVQADGPHADSFTGTVLFHLTADDANAVLRTLHTATGASPSAPQPGTPTGEVSAPNNSLDSNPRPLPRPQPSGQQRSRPVSLQLLGPLRIHTADGAITTGVRRSARDLLAYLALHPNGVARDRAIGALWPDHDPEAAANQFNTAIANIRKTLRTATGLREPMYVIHTAGNYRLDTDLIDTDLWRLTKTLDHARHATTDSDRITALARVIDLYTADFATDLTHDWAETYRDHLRCTVTDALTRQARLLHDEKPDLALAALKHAITLDPYAEPLYRDLMQLQAQLGHTDAARRTYQLLSTRLADLDTEPDDRTHQLLKALQGPHTR
ncbi:BTAD domain-containing putative transcriptional regulator [Actinomadura geliboluensis]|uniref:BTAD domain-containing putative transcriptional regulator n=1 Tax=Actinomadura geliboluensis TaxID=882440 RepID=UPI00261A13CC|nr:BTAD domain-containing putative transcriptional regulator [Actinomadura geliboluensis]